MLQMTSARQLPRCPSCTYSDEGWQCQDVWHCPRPPGRMIDRQAPQEDGNVFVALVWVGLLWAGAVGLWWWFR